jgi:hypothetical protein
MEFYEVFFKKNRERKRIREFSVFQKKLRLKNGRGKIPTAFFKQATGESRSARALKKNKKQGRTLNEN